MTKVSVPTVEYQDILAVNGGWYVRLFPKVEGDMTVAYEAYQRTEPTEADIEALKLKCIEDARRYKISEIEAYDVSDAVNGFMLNGQLVWLDKDMRMGLVNLVNSRIASQQTTATLWFGTVAFTVPCETALQMLAQLECYAGDCFNVTAMHKAAVIAATDMNAIQDFDITADYPEKPSFNIEIV